MRKFNVTLFGVVLLGALLLLAGCSTVFSEKGEAIPEKQSQTEKPKEKVAEPPIQIKISAVGDLMCHEPQYTAAKTADGYDFTPSLEAIKDAFIGSDLVIGNLETTMAGPESGYSEYPQFNTPDAFAAALKDAGFNVLTTANNHALDRRYQGVVHTLDVLDQMGIAHTGSFRTPEEDRVLVGTFGGLRIAFVAYTYGTNGIAPDSGKEFAINYLTEEALRSGVQKAHQQGADAIIVSLHFGQEYQRAYGAEQTKLVDAALNEGADIVLGSHPHVVQGHYLKPVTDRYGVSKNRFVAYSLGNFLTSQRDRYRDAGVIAQLTLEKKDGVTQVNTASFIPTWVDQSYDAGRYNIRVLPIEKLLKAPTQYSFITELDLKKAQRGWNDVTETLYWE